MYKKQLPQDHQYPITETQILKSAWHWIIGTDAFHADMKIKPIYLLKLSYPFIQLMTDRVRN